MGRSTSGRRLDIWRADGFWSAAVATAVVAVCAIAGPLQWLEYRVYDTATRVAPSPALPEIAVISIDDASLASIGSWPWPRDVYAQLIDQLSAAGAKTIVLAPPLVEPQSDRSLGYIRKMRGTLARAGETSPLIAELDRTAVEAESALDTDARLAASIQRAGNVFLVSGYRLAGGIQAPLPPYAHRSVLPDTGAFATPATSARHPLEKFGTVAAGVGQWTAAPDDDANVRRIPLLLKYDNVSVPSVAVLAARHSLHLGQGEVRVQGAPPGLRLGGLFVPTDDAATMRPRFHAAQGDSTAFPTTSFEQVLSGKVPAHNFTDRIVLIGETSQTLAVPWGSADRQTMYSIEVLAHTISGIRQGLGVQRPPWAAMASWGSAVGALLLLALVLPRLPRAAGGGIGAAAALALAGAEWSGLRYAGQWIPLMPGVLALLAGTAALILLRTPRQDAATGAEAAETDRMMGLALQGQGQLDMALERLRRVPPSDALMDNLYHLAQDFERKRNFAKAKSVYKLILQHNRGYKDAYARYKRARAHLQKDTNAPAGHSTPSSLPPQTAPRLPGDAAAGIPMLGRYQIHKEIGKGAMGVVYLGRDPKIGRIVAIKTLALGEEFEGDALIDARARFFREAETAGRLQHPYIVTIFDAGEEHDLAYIAMEFLKGHDLTQACRKEALLPIETVISIAARVAEALDYAHAHNVVHRDIKPANIMFDGATDSVKVTDFGIARITDSSKTRTGLVLGTPSFMSPEQLAGKKVDGRSDLYSLGVTLFQLLTGSLPLRGESMTELMHKIASVDAPDIRQLRPELSPELARVVAQTLQKNPHARYQTGGHLASELRQAGTAQGRAGTVPQPGAVVYDADRDATGHEMADYQHTVMEPPAGRGAASRPVSGAQ